MIKANEEATITTSTDITTTLRTTVYTNPNRIHAIDIQRGFIMMVMALSHCREYIAAQIYANNDWDMPATWAGHSFLDFIELFFVNAVAPGFYMMMGMGIIFFHQSRLKDGWSEKKICRYLMVRGGLLILLQLTVLQLFEFVAEQRIYFYAGVLMTLGLCMIAAALCVYITSQLKTLSRSQSLPVDYLLPLALIVVITCIAQITVNHLQQGITQPSLWKILFILCGNYQSSIELDINFTPLTWFPPVLFGLMMGQFMLAHREKIFNLMGSVALIFFSAWFLLRSANLLGWLTFGSYKTLPAGDSLSFTAYLCMSKYPPSLTYFLWTLGLNLAAIYGLSKIELHARHLSRLLDPIKLFGQCALFFFVLHWFVYFGLSLILPQKLTSAWEESAIWLTGLLILYPLCKTFNAFKLRQAKESFWRMF